MVDPGTETQVVQGLKSRNIYDASPSEIAWRSFAAGFFLGVGKTTASVAIWAIVIMTSLQLLQPLISPLLTQMEVMTNLLQQQQDVQQNTGTNIDNILRQLGR